MIVRLEPAGPDGMADAADAEVEGWPAGSGDGSTERYGTHVRSTINELPRLEDALSATALSSRGFGFGGGSSE